jgi:hypothetical protein
MEKDERAGNRPDPAAEPGSSRGSGPGSDPIRRRTETRPEHPSRQAFFLVVGVTLLILLLALMTTLGGGR